jgi:hypothetical protein
MTNFSYRQAAILIALAFIGGAAAGGFGMSLYTAKTVTAKAPAKTPQQWRAEYVQTLTSRLKLDGSQVTDVNRVLDETKNKFDAAKDRHKTEMSQIHQEQVDNIRATLKPDQAAEYDKFRAEREAERKKRQLQEQQQSGK